MSYLTDFLMHILLMDEWTNKKNYHLLNFIHPPSPFTRLRLSVTDYKF